METKDDYYYYTGTLPTDDISIIKSNINKISKTVFKLKWLSNDERAPYMEYWRLSNKLKVIMLHKNKREKYTAWWKQSNCFTRLRNKHWKVQ